MRRLLCLFLLLFSVTTLTQGQAYSEDYSFFRSGQIPVISHNDTLAYPWAGGINAIHFSEIDLDMDGTPDLFGFEKHGNRTLTFLRRGEHYEYAPEYAKLFPELHDWVILRDYNFDGKPDIFTYGLAGIRVFRNTSTSTLDFQLVTDQLQAYYYNGYVNIFASPDDYLIVEDIDNDGHLDILNFWVLGKYVHHLRNLSNDPELFDFHLESECWGHFEEAADNNTITLFSDCNSKNGVEEGPVRHTGSSMMLHDFDHNGLKDVLIGDVDSPNLILLYNHGTAQDARMTAQDTAFPPSNPVILFSMPAPSLIQLPDHNSPALLVSPSDPSLNKSQDLNSVWRYDYDTVLQQYVLSNTAFLQEEMLDAGSGCRPVLYDWNNDGRMDLFLANYGSFDSVAFVNGFPVPYFSSSIQYYENAGTVSQPVFQLQNEDFGNLKQLGYRALHPTFGDFDGDGLVDMLCGLEDGTLLLAHHDRLVSDSGRVVPNFMDIDVGKYSTPTFFDLDQDGRNDLIIGNQRGLLSFYRNNGICGILNFEHITDSLGGVDVRDPEQSYFGYSVPCFYRDSSHGTALFCSCEKGNIFYYKDIDDNLYGIFSDGGIIWESEDASCHYCASQLREGRRAGAAIARLDGDAYPDLIVGNYAGGVTYLQGRTPVMHHSAVSYPTSTPFRAFPNPTSGILTIESDIPVENAVFYDITGRILFQSNGNIFNISALPDGLYILEINRNTRMKILKSTR